VYRFVDPDPAGDLGGQDGVGRRDDGCFCDGRCIACLGFGIGIGIGIGTWGSTFKSLKMTFIRMVCPAFDDDIAAAHVNYRRRTMVLLLIFYAVVCAVDGGWDHLEDLTLLGVIMDGSGDVCDGGVVLESDAAARRIR
jgi:hypothetical protein